MKLLSTPLRPLWLALLSLAAPLADAAEKRPNVLLILADDLGYSDLSSFGSEIETPNLDRLATGGAAFSTFYNSARCCPSRASLMTGLHPHEAGIGSFATRTPRGDDSRAYTGHLLPDTVTIAELLGDAGYSTWMVGKWHMGIPGPIERGFRNYYGYRNFLAYAENQWDPAEYIRLPEGATRKIREPRGDFYATDVFSDYALEFLDQAREADHEALEPKPWFLFLSHSSPHFPVQAPADTIDKYMDVYRRGWDVLRKERLERQKSLGLVPPDASLPPRSEVPVDREDIANGFPGEPNPAWDSLSDARREDLARRMAAYAAMVDHVDRGVGRILDDLEANGDLDNTLILFTSDNGACYEWGPFGFDGRSRRGNTILHEGEELREMGQDGSHMSYGSAWANLCNTPLNMYKHFCHEGGIAAPLLVHWPDGVEPREGYIDDPGHVMDVLPTIAEAAGVEYPESRGGTELQPLSGTSLLEVFRGGSLSTRALAFEHKGARGLREGDWKIVRGKRQPDPVKWELYNLSEDLSEQNDLREEHPEKLRELVGKWETWARDVGADPFAKPGSTSNFPDHPTPRIANRPIRIEAEITPESGDGVVVAQGGDRFGYALYLDDGEPRLAVRVDGEVRTLDSEVKIDGRVKLVAVIDEDEMRLTIGDRAPATGRSPGLIPTQPTDSLNVGRDRETTAGDYRGPNPFEGEIHAIRVTTGETAASGVLRD